MSESEPPKRLEVCSVEEIRLRVADYRQLAKLLATESAREHLLQWASTLEALADQREAGFEIELSSSVLKPGNLGDYL